MGEPLEASLEERDCGQGEGSCLGVSVPLICYLGCIFLPPCIDCELDPGRLLIPK